jgi:hypothetical protein
MDKGQHTEATVYDSTTMPLITGTSLPIIATSAYRIAEINMGRRRQPHVTKINITGEPIKCLTYNNPLISVYKKCGDLLFRIGLTLTDHAGRYIFTADGRHLLGGMMIRDTRDFVKLVAVVKKKVT